MHIHFVDEIVLRFHRIPVQIALTFYHANKLQAVERLKRQPNVIISDYLCPLSYSLKGEN